MRRFLLFFILSIAAPAFAQAVRYPADHVVFDDTDTAQAKFDVGALSGAAQTGSGDPNGSKTCSLAWGEFYIDTSTTHGERWVCLGSDSWDRLDVSADRVVFSDGTTLQDRDDDSKILNASLPDVLCGTDFPGDNPGCPIDDDYKRACACGNFPFDAFWGGVDGNGISDYDSPTNVGGGARRVTCADDGDASGDPGEAACLYTGDTYVTPSDPNLILAKDQLIRGGTLYLPTNHYVMDYCGVDADNQPIKCPVTNANPFMYSHKFNIDNDVKVVGAGADDGIITPPYNLLDGTALLLANGTTQSSPPSNFDEGGNDPGIWEGEAWGPRLGHEGYASICYNDGSYPLGQCVAQNFGYEQGDPQKVWVNPPLGEWGRYISIDTTTDWRYYTKTATGTIMCVNNSLSLGVCAQDPRLQCTTNSGYRTSATTGSCVSQQLSWDAGPCKGMADMIEYDSSPVGGTYGGTLGRRDLLLIGLVAPHDKFGQAASYDDGLRYETVYIRPNDVSASSCGSGGKWVYMMMMSAQDVVGSGDPVFSDTYAVPFPNIRYDWSEFTVPALTAVHEERLKNLHSEVTDLTIMPRVWVRRISKSADASCPYPYTDPQCDDTSSIALGASLGGKFDRVTFLHGGGDGAAFSAWDGNPTQHGMGIYHFLVRGMTGNLSDIGPVEVAYGRIEHSYFSTHMMSINFGGGTDFHDNEVVNNQMKSLFRCQDGSGGRVSFNHIVGDNFADSVFDFQDCVDMTVEGNKVAGAMVRSGPVVMFGTKSGRDIWNDVLKDNDFKNIMTDNLSVNPRGLIAITDAYEAVNGTGVYDSGDMIGIVSERNHFWVDGDDDICGYYFGGLTGNLSDTNNGADRMVTKWRTGFRADGDIVEIYNDGSAAGTWIPFCFGNELRNDWCTAPGVPFSCCTNPDAGTCETNQALTASDADMLELKDVTGRLPQIHNFVFNEGTLDLPYLPDIEWRFPASEIPDADTLSYGQKASIYDDTTASGTCADATSDGVLDGAGSPAYPSMCCADPAGGGGTGSWASCF